MIFYNYFSIMAYPFLNVFFFVFHSGLVLFNLTGWIFPKTKKLHLISVMLTAFSWFFLGIWYGWGYCYCTDWHWEVRKHLGYADPPDSYIHFLLSNLLHLELDPKLVDQSTLIVFLILFAVSVWVNRKRPQPQS